MKILLIIESSNKSVYTHALFLQAASNAQCINTLMASKKKVENVTNTKNNVTTNTNVKNENSMKIINVEIINLIFDRLEVSQLDIKKNIF